MILQKRILKISDTLLKIMCCKQPVQSELILKLQATMYKYDGTCTFAFTRSILGIALAYSP